MGVERGGVKAPRKKLEEFFDLFDPPPPTHSTPFEMVKNSSKNNRKKVGKAIKLKIPANKYKSGATKLGWDPKKTALQNIKERGLGYKINDYPSLFRQRGLRLNASDPAEFLSMVDGVAPPLAGGTLEGRNPLRRPHFMKEEEVEYLQLLVAKYGTNFMAMAKDIKANYLQHSASHLETRCTRLEKWLASESKSEYMEDGEGEEGEGEGEEEEEGGAAGGDAMEEEEGAAGGKSKGKKKGPAAPTSAAPEPVVEQDKDWSSFARKGIKVKAVSKLR